MGKATQDENLFAEFVKLTEVRAKGPLFRQRVVARFLGVSESFLEQDRVRERRIPFVKMGRAVAYRPCDVGDFAERSLVGGR